MRALFLRRCNLEQQRLKLWRSFHETQSCLEHVGRARQNLFNHRGKTT